MLHQSRKSTTKLLHPHFTCPDSLLLASRIQPATGVSPFTYIDIEGYKSSQIRYDAHLHHSLVLLLLFTQLHLQSLLSSSLHHSSLVCPTCFHQLFPPTCFHHVPTSHQVQLNSSTNHQRTSFYPHPHSTCPNSPHCLLAVSTWHLLFPRSHTSQICTGTVLLQAYSVLTC